MRAVVKWNLRNNLFSPKPLYARVVKWQTRYFEVVVSESSCGFKSRPVHH